MKPIRILIADDHPVFRFGMRALLETEADFEVVAEASTGEEAIALTNQLRPDIVLMDITMPSINGIEATRHILEQNPETGVLIVTMLDDDSLVPAMRAGARGYLLKGADGEETLRAIRAVAHGEAIFSPSIAERLAELVKSSDPEGVESPFPELTPRELEVLTLISQGMTNAEIAGRLSLSLKTVRNHVSNILNKLQVSDRLQAALRAREAGLGQQKPSDRGGKLKP
ncbi:MAG: response regulator transcription factor [Anaerolineales bacterium]